MTCHGQINSNASEVEVDFKFISSDSGARMFSLYQNGKSACQSSFLQVFLTVIEKKSELKVINAFRFDVRKKQYILELAKSIMG